MAKKSPTTKYYEVLLSAVVFVILKKDVGVEGKMHCLFNQQPWCPRQGTREEEPRG